MKAHAELLSRATCIYSFIYVSIHRQGGLANTAISVKEFPNIDKVNMPLVVLPTVFIYKNQSVAIIAYKP